MKKVLLILLILSSSSFSTSTFDVLKNKKKISYLDFVLLKIENRLIQRHGLLGAQYLVMRVQYQHIGTQVDFIEEKSRIDISFTGVMDKQRYSKKKYEQKMSDCNQVRNIIFYNKHGYKFFTQKRDPALSEGIMIDIFESVFLNNLNLTKEEINFLLDKMYINITVFHPIKKNELVCSGKVNDYELK